MLKAELAFDKTKRQNRVRRARTIGQLHQVWRQSRDLVRGGGIMTSRA